MEPDPRLSYRAAGTDVLDQQLAGAVPFGPGMATKQRYPIDGLLLCEILAAMLTLHAGIDPPRPRQMH